ncbi:MAG: hypothetical protein ACI4EN_06345 [Butyrivibrio sp.]
MIKSLWKMYEASLISDANRLIFGLSKIPLINKKITEDTYNGSKTGFKVAAAILGVLLEFIKKTLFVLAFMYVPMRLFSRWMPAGVTGFGPENSYVYFGLVLCGLCGSVINSEIFSKDEHSFMMLKLFGVNPTDYFRMRLLGKSVSEFAAFWFAFSVCGMNIVKALYLTLVIVLARFAGETFNILVFRVTGKAFTDIRGINVFAMLAALILAYFIPYIRGCVPAAYNLVFSTIWLPVILIAAGFFMYYVWNYNGYTKIAVRIYKSSYLYEEEKGFELKEKIRDTAPVPEIETDILINDEKAFECMNKSFFKDNRKMLLGGIITRLLILSGVAAVAIAAAAMGKGDIVYKVISYSMPVLVFIMYSMSRGRMVCRELFYSCDSGLMRRGCFRDRELLFKSYLVRVRDMVITDGIPAIYLAIIYGVAGILAGKPGSASTVISVCVGILLLCLFFSNYNVFMYYICMPFSIDENKESNTRSAVIYKSVNFVMYILCYLCIFIETTSLYFTLGTALVLAVFMSASATAVVKAGRKTFRLKDTD